MIETSIIIRTFNEENHLPRLLDALSKQTYRDFEVILVDSGSTDQTLTIAQGCCQEVIQIQSRDFTFGYSLNIGCAKGKGKYIVLISAHALPVDNQWLANLLAPFHDEKVGMVYGKQIGAEESKFSERRDFQKLFSGSSKCVNNANSAFRKELWREYPFDEYLFGLEDIEWAKKITAKGLLVYYEPKASVYHIHTEKWHQVFNRYRREAIAAFRIGLSHPPQARTNLFWLVSNLVQDFFASLPNISWGRLEEIIRFRYYQWKGSRQGWYRDRDIDLNRDKYTLFFPTQNKAVVIKGKHQASMEEMPLPKMKPGDILIQVSHVGVCRTDLEIHDGSLDYYQSGLAYYPIVPGHEFSGKIIQIGANNKYRERFKVGGKVIGECILSRGPIRQEVGVINYHGAYSQFMVMPGEYLHQIPEDLDLKIACLAEPLAVVLRAIKRLSSRLKPDDNIAVIGAGSIGNLCTQVLTRLGYRVAVFDKNKNRIEFLRDKAKEVSRTLGNLEKFNVIIEATGSVEVMGKILRESRPDVTILLLGFPYGNIDYNFEDIVGQEKVIIGSVGGSAKEFREALQLLPELDTARFTENILPLTQFMKAWRLHNSQKHLKIILEVD